MLHPLVKRLLDGEVTLADLPPELRRQGEQALRLLESVDRSERHISVEQRVMDAVRRVERRARFRPWLWGPALAAAAVLAFLMLPRRAADAGDPMVRFVFYAPNAHAVALAGSFNDWSTDAALLARADAGVWTITLQVPPGQHQYAFVVDGRWVADPAAPAVDDGFGRRNSVLAVGALGAAL
jgi:hypothetical protein